MRSVVEAGLSRCLAWLRRRRAAAFWSHRHLGSREEWAFWLAVPEVMRWVNSKVSGKPEIWPLSWFQFSLPSDVVPVRYALSLGCGPGNLEREVIRLETARQITGIDVSPASLDLARRLAREAGFSQRIHYHRASALHWLRQRESVRDIDLIFFHGSLHHFEDLEAIVQACAERLEGGNPGLLYADEYIGPSRDEWGPGAIGHAAALFERVPNEFRQAKQLKPPVAFQDPTEMIRSSEILGVLRSRFEFLEFKPYYGNVVMPLISGIKPEGLEHAEIRRILDEAMQLEDYLADRGLIDPMYAIIVARPRRAPLTP